MTDKMRSFITFALAVLILTSCEDDPFLVDVSGIDSKVKIEHFERDFYALDSAALEEQVESLKAKYPAILNGLSSEALFARRFSRTLEMLYKDSKVSIPEYDELDEQMKLAFTHLQYYYPNTGAVEVITYLSFLDFDYPILYIDSLKKMFVGIDLYLGEDHPAYQQLPQYQRMDHQVKYLVGDMMEELALTKIEIDLDNSTLLNDMIYWGKVLYFKEALLPHTDKKDLIRYDEAHWQFCLNNEQQMWQYFVKEQLLFSSELDLKRRFINIAPFSKFRLPNDPETPGMVGRWMGWQIVRNYMKNNREVTLHQLMKETDAAKILRESKYKP